MIRLASLLPVLAFFALAAPAEAAKDDAVPYWASVDAEVANMRVGPGESYKIEWVYRRMHLPVKVIRREGSWRQIEDPDGDNGWMRDLLLSRQRTMIVKGEKPVEMHSEARGSSPLLWRAEPGVVGFLGECKEGWCAIDVDGHKGFARQNALWGAGKP